MPNGFAYLVLFGYLPFGIALFTVLRPALAATLVMMLSFMFLPEQTQLDLPGLPGLGKHEVAALACFLGVLLRARRRLWAAKPLRGPDLLIIVMFIGDLATAATNKEGLVRGVVQLPALTTWEGMSMMMADAMTYLLPFLVARALFTSARDLKTLLLVLAVAGAAYTPLLFIELMMSPQMHNWIYGFAQHDFIQTMRGDGYRPMVFMGHGLVVGLFMSWATIAAVTLYKARRAILGMPAPIVALYDFGFLAWCKSLGATIYAMSCAPLLVFFKPRAIARICFLLALVVITYPVLRATEVFPQAQMVSLAQSVAGPARAQSLEYRFEMERLLTDHSAAKPWFGWGRFKRNMVFDEYTGRAVSVSDGHWIVTYSIKGAVGFLATFLLLTLPLFVLRKRLKRIDAPEERTMLAGLGLIVAVSVVDLLPNGLQNVFTIFMCGALWGVSKAMASPASVSPVAPLRAPTTLPFDPPDPPPPVANGVPPPFRASQQPPTGTRKKEDEG